MGYKYGFTSSRNVKGAAQKCRSDPASWFPITFGKAGAPVSAAFFRLRGPLQAVSRGDGLLIEDATAARLRIADI
jgi:hypothetical protein